MELNELRDKIHANAVSKGFYNDEMNGWAKACNLDIGVEAIKHAFFAQEIALIHSELSEAIEADRKNNHANMDCFCACTFDSDSEIVRKEAFDAFIKDTVEDEFADTIIRILALCGWLGTDIGKHIELKMRYNELREHKHGKEY